MFDRQSVNIMHSPLLKRTSGSSLTISRGELSPEANNHLQAEVQDYASERSASPIAVQYLRSDISNMKDWEFPGWGTSSKVTIADTDLKSAGDKKGHMLSQWPATAICGNDILSSCLYVSGLTAASAGKLSPLVLLLVAIILSFYKRIYSEVVTALPKNGGVFNALIHTTSKGNAAFASCLSILSYVATGVVSACSAANYLINFINTIHGGEVKLVTVDEYGVAFTISLLFIFAMLCFMGLKESSFVAMCMFFTHVATLALLVVYCTVNAFQNQWALLQSNWQQDYPTVTISGTEFTNNWAASLFMGFSCALLGVSGFESSSQFVEEQAPGVFRKTLRNMLYSVAFFNPVISLLSYSVLPKSVIEDVRSQPILLSMMAKNVESSGFLNLLVSGDAFIVLCGAVLTAYVGVTGLIRRIASDRCLPQFLLTRNSWRDSNHYIIFGFFALSSSLTYVFQGQLGDLSGVYTISFLSVLTIFGCACIVLKVKRPDIPRDEVAPWWALTFGIIGVVTGLIGNILGKPEVLREFVLYFGSIGLFMWVMYQRIRILKLIQNAVKGHKYANALISRIISRIVERPIVFFSKTNDMAVMNKAVLYVRENEQTQSMLFVHIAEADLEESQEIENIFVQHVSLLDNMYPKIKLNSLIVYGGKFNADTIEYLSDHLGIPQNYMFIAAPNNIRMRTIGGLRIITH